MHINTKTTRQRARRGFTLIETLVAVAILMIAIAGPLVAANKGLVAAYHAKNQSIASFLAQEEMEIIRNAKDTLIYQDAASGNDGQFQAMFKGILQSCTEDNPCAVWISNSNSLPYDPGSVRHCNGVNSCLLYWDSDGTKPAFYLSGNNSSKLIFTRDFFIENISDTESRVTVVVSWSENGIASEVRIRSNMVSSVI